MEAKTNGEGTPKNESNKNKRKKRNNKRKASNASVASINQVGDDEKKVCHVTSANGFPDELLTKPSSKSPSKDNKTSASSPQTLVNGNTGNCGDELTEIKETIKQLVDKATSELVVMPNILQQSSLESNHHAMDSRLAKTNGAPPLVNGKLNGVQAPPTMNGNPGEAICKICGKNVYHMEQIKAVMSVFHKSCFRCKECSKQLNVDSYSSHEGIIYCTPHFKQLFQPKAAFHNDDQPTKQERPKKYELIICENTPIELPADVVRYDSKQEIELENLNLDLSNIRNRFERGCTDTNNNNKNDKCQGRRGSDNKTITRSESIHKIMQKYQSRLAGDKSVNSSDDEEASSPPSTPLDRVSSSSSSIATETNNADKVSFNGMSALKSQWESGQIVNARTESDSVKSELEELRQKHKSTEPLKQVYERAVQEAKSVDNLNNRSDSVVTLDNPVKAVAIKQIFENGSLETESEEDRREQARREREEEISRLNNSETITKEARSIFKLIEANMGKETVNGVVDKLDDVSINPDQMQQRFKYFENLKDNQVVKEAVKDEAEDIPKGDTTKKMLSKFKALEAGQDSVDSGPQTPKRITPPREVAKVYESQPIADPSIVKSSYKTEEVIAVEPEKAKNLRAKFENWQTEIEREGRKNQEEEEYVPHIDTTKNLRAKFESIKDEQKPVDKPRPKVNRFVESVQTETCYVCSNKLYPMEKMEFSGIKLHKNCFRCNKCHTTLRLDNFTIRAEKLFCIPHFKQLFMERGNYDEGFGLEQHKDKWSSKSNGTPSTPAKTNGMATKADNVAPVTNGTTVEAKEEPEQLPPVADNLVQVDSDNLESLEQNYCNDHDNDNNEDEKANAEESTDNARVANGHQLIEA